MDYDKKRLQRENDEGYEKYTAHKRRSRDGERPPETL